HNAYWRLETALDGTSGNLASGIDTLERRAPGPTLAWTPISREGVFTRPADGFAADWWRIRNPATGFEYVLEPGEEAGSAAGDDYARGDLWALAYNAGQIDDPNVGTAIGID